jgi:hypothetical protein
MLTRVAVSNFAEGAASIPPVNVRSTSAPPIRLRLTPSVEEMERPTSTQPTSMQMTSQKMLTGVQLADEAKQITMDKGRRVEEVESRAPEERLPEEKCKDELGLERKEDGAEQTVLEARDTPVGYTSSFHMPMLTFVHVTTDHCCKTTIRSEGSVRRGPF